MLLQLPGFGPHPARPFVHAGPEVNVTHTAPVGSAAVPVTVMPDAALGNVSTDRMVRPVTASDNTSASCVPTVRTDTNRPGPRAAAGAVPAGVDDPVSETTNAETTPPASSTAQHQPTARRI